MQQWGVAVVEWLSFWLEEQEIRGSIPGLATCISEIDYLLLPSRDKAEIQLERRKSSIQPTNQSCNNVPKKHFKSKFYNRTRCVLNTLPQQATKYDSISQIQSHQTWCYLTGIISVVCIQNMKYLSRTNQKL